MKTSTNGTLLCVPTRPSPRQRIGPTRTAPIIEAMLKKLDCEIQYNEQQTHGSANQQPGEGEIINLADAQNTQVLRLKSLSAQVLIKRTGLPHGMTSAFQPKMRIAKAGRKAGLKTTIWFDGCFATISFIEYPFGEAFHVMVTEMLKPSGEK